MKKVLSLFLILPVALSFTSCHKNPPALPGNQIPTANAGPNIVLTLLTDSAELAGSGTDPEGGTLSYSWKKISGPPAFLILHPNNAVTKLRDLIVAEYEFELTVTDNGGLSARDSVRVTVLAAVSSNLPLYVGTLSVSRVLVAVGAAANKVLFAGGTNQEQGTDIGISRVDIYDTITQSWSTADLSIPRVGIGAVSVGNKILFAGGARDFDYNFGWGNLTTRVDIYDALTNTWSTTELPEPQLFVWGFGTATSTGTKAYFYSSRSGANSIHVFDVISNSWSTISMNGSARYDHASASVGSKVLFAGGLSSGIGYLDRVDIWNGNTNSWVVNALSERRTFIKATTINEKILFAGGQMPVGNFKSTVDIYDDQSQTWSVSHLSRPAVLAGAATIGNKGIFFEGTLVDVFDAVSNTWSVANLDISVEFDHSALIASGNSVYVAGAKFNSVWYYHIWKLSF